MKIWHLLAVVSGTTIAIVMGCASISYNATLGTHEPAFDSLPLVTNAMLFSSLALAFDLGMIASVFGFLNWFNESRIRALVCAVLFVIASLYSVHSVRGYIASNITNARAPAERSADIYQSLKSDLQHDQDYRIELRKRLSESRRRSERREIENRIEQISSKIHDTRSRLARTDNAAHIAPLAGLEWFLAVTLWFFNATCWSAWFGSKTRAHVLLHDTVAAWLEEFDLSNPVHCSVLYDNYSDWCTQQREAPLPQYSFYARLIELGATKFRDGRNGPTKYVMAPEGSR